MKFGIEEEFFIADAGGGCPSLEQMEGCFELFAKHGNGRTLDKPKAGAMLPAEYGTVGVWNDFSTNILEVAYPALAQPQQFLQLKQWLDQLLEQTLPDCGLSVQPGTVRFHSAADVVVCPAPDPHYQRRLTQDLNRPDNGRPLFNRLFYADICSTQVSLSLDRTEWQKLARGLYEYEHLVPWIFSKPTVLDGTRWRCLRHQILADNWPDDPFVGHPLDLEQLFTEVDSASPARTVKYANVISRSGERVEFRSCDRLNSAHEILEMTLLRILAVTAVGKDGDSDDYSKYRNLFTDACGSATVQPEIVGQQRLRLRSAWSHLGSSSQSDQWAEYAQTLLGRIEELAELDATKA